jgi:hypothetical protein
MGPFFVNLVTTGDFMIHARSCLLALALGAALVLPGCGSDTNVKSQNVSVSKGQQLMDLQKAKEAGIITEKEYEKQKEMVLKSSY